LHQSSKNLVFKGLIILLDIVISFVKNIFVFNLIFDPDDATQGFLDFLLTSSSALPAIETHNFYNAVNISNDALNNNRSASVFQTVKKFRQCSDSLINFLLNEEKGASIMGSECGIPASKAGLAAAQAAGAVKDLVAEANAKVMAFTTNKLDPLFENNDLKASGTGIYQEVFDNIDYGDQTPEEAVETLLDGMESVGYTIG